MKLTVSISALLRLLALLALGLASAVQADPATTPLTPVSYDRTADRLSVSVEAASLKSVLGQIARQSGIEVLFDEAADRPLSIDIQSSSLENVLEQILRGSSHVMRYGKNEKGERLLIGIMVLPAGQQDTSRARALLDQDDEAYQYARKMPTTDGYVSTGDLNDERWQARLAEMPDKLREQLEQRAAKRHAMEEERQQQRQLQEEKYAAHKKESAAKRAERQQKQQDMLNALDPERRAKYEQSGELARQEIRQKLQNEQP